MHCYVFLSNVCILNVSRFIIVELCTSVSRYVLLALYYTWYNICTAWFVGCNFLLLQSELLESRKKICILKAELATKERTMENFKAELATKEHTMENLKVRMLINDN